MEFHQTPVSLIRQAELPIIIEEIKPSSKQRFRNNQIQAAAKNSDRRQTFEMLPRCHMVVTFR
jgi:hypothetical protein